MNNAGILADDLGPVKIIHVQNPALGIDGILVVDNTAIGPAIGGLRMAPDVSPMECARLARAMTLKNAAAGLPHGGGKSVLVGDPRMDRTDKELVIRGFAAALASERSYIFGPDMGTDETCMAWIRDEIGRAVGLPRQLGGIPLDEIGATGWGLAAATEEAQAYTGIDLNGARVAVQGFGSVGRHAARFLAEKGAVLVAAADSGGTVWNPDGLDLESLLALKAEGRSVVDHGVGATRDTAAIIGVDCDIWIPAARPDVITADNVGTFKGRLVLQGANIPVTDAAERTLHERGVVVVPDFIANAGGVICAAMEYTGATQEQAMATIAAKVGTNTRAVLERSRVTGAPPREAAVALATERVRAAMDSRRWGIM